MTVKILWRDATSCDEWFSYEHDLSIKNCNVIETCGYLIDETNDVIMIALSKDCQTGAISNAIYIPKSLIIERYDWE